MVSSGNGLAAKLERCVRRALLLPHHATEAVERLRSVEAKLAGLHAPSAC